MTVWPNNKKFAFTIVDDTDNSTVESVKPVYDFLHQQGLITTKTVWPYPSRDRYTGQCLQDDEYLHFVLDLDKKGFEIALHNAGSGFFNREEILAGLELFNTSLGYYPSMQINHSNNPDNIYWGYKRYVPPLSWLFSLSAARRIARGESVSSDCFWGDAHKKYIKYTRNYVFKGINTIAYNPEMPYRDKKKEQFSNYWFSSSDAHTVKEFNALTNPSALDDLEASHGLCIAYTHFNSGYSKHGALDSEFMERIQDISSRDGWFAPASEILDYLLAQGYQHRSLSYLDLLKLDMRWLRERVVKEIRFRTRDRT